MNNECMLLGIIWELSRHYSMHGCVLELYGKICRNHAITHLLQHAANIALIETRINCNFHRSKGNNPRVIYWKITIHIFPLNFYTTTKNIINCSRGRRQRKIISVLCKFCESLAYDRLVCVNKQSSLSIKVIVTSTIRRGYAVFDISITPVCKSSAIFMSKALDIKHTCIKNLWVDIWCM